MELETPVVCLAKAKKFKYVCTVRAIRALSDWETHLCLFAITLTRHSLSFYSIVAQKNKQWHSKTKTDKRLERALLLNT